MTRSTLCLACKGCCSDCPVNVDMATYKAEFLSHHYRHRLRPMAHYSMGWIPLWARLAATTPGAVNAVTHAQGLATAHQGGRRCRPAPRLAPLRRPTVQPWFGSRFVEPAAPSGTVVLWPDTFTNNFEPGIARDAVTVLESAGFDVEVPRRAVCCGLTWISTGQLDIAKRVLHRTLTVLRPALRAGTPVVVFEPSCAAVFRSDMPELLHGDEDAHRLANQTNTLGELLRRNAPDWHPPQIGVSAWYSRTAISTRCCTTPMNGICSMTPACRRTFSMLDVAGWRATSVSSAATTTFRSHAPKTSCFRRSAAAGPDTLVLADGFSCRTQIRQLAADREPRHIAQVLAAAVRCNANVGPDAGDARVAIRGDNNPVGR